MSENTGRKNTGLRARVRRRINITVILAIYLVASAACFVTSTIYRELKEETVASELSNCSSQMEAWLNEKSIVTDFMAHEIIDRGYDTNLDECLGFLADCIKRDDQVFDCYIGFADSTCLFGGGWEPAPGEYDPTTRDWYKDAAAADGVIITDPYTDAQTGKQVITIAVKLERNDKLIGVLARDLFIDKIADVVNSLHIDRNGYALLTTEDGSIIVHKNQEYIPYVDENENDVVTKLGDVMKGYTQDNASEGITSLTDYDGSKVNYAETAVNITGWRLGYSLDLSEYNSKIVSVLVLFAVLLCVFSLMLSFWVAFSLRLAFRPLKSVANTAKKVSEGLLDVSFDYTDNDEIGDVCRTIESNNLVVKNYIDDISRRLNGISHGNFDIRSDVEYIGDYAPIKESMDNISASLGQIFSGIDGASNAVFGGAGGVANGANHLAESVSKQTELIGEIVSGVDTVSEKISNNVERTDEARGVARRTAEVVRTSSEQMSELLRAMEDISRSSEEIKKIIGTIEDIAFQTNILALNASVEAARAGAAGKGFAVVADEVRNLAGKSSEASEQTAKLIEHSADAVSNGMKFADATSNSLKKVVEQTDEIDGIIVKINEDSHEQRTYIDDVSEKINLVADYVTSAAANAEESAAASEELNGQAAALKEMLQKFGV